MEENAEPAVIRAQKSGGSRLPPLVIPRRNHQAPWLFPKDLSSAALLTALLAAATFLAATAPLAAARLLPAGDPRPAVRHRPVGRLAVQRL